MKEYFQLQFRMSNRKLTEFGLPPFLAYALLTISFVGLSVYLFSKSEFAEYLYILLAFSLLTKLTNIKRNEFLKSCFNQKDYIKLRLLENIIIILPFALFLIFQKSIVFIPILITLTIVLAFVNFNTTLNLTIPTPFYKKPFEFTVGFRNTFLVFPLAYSLTYISISVGNFNLGVFSMLLVFLVSLSYYSKLENEYYIWSFNLSPKDFLIEKIKTGLLHTTLSSTPILIALVIYFNSELETLLTFLILGFAFLITIILAKYSVYPNEMNIPQGLLIAVSLIFPPILIGIIPYFYFQSTKRLNTILQ
ncbi:ABC transporter permease [Maribacter sp. MJ134]|nr:ABC transporter permease [Maribacter sp. MJ134]